MLEIKNLTFSYPGKRKLLNNISVSFPKGKITTILGPNGSGKSTLLKLACGIMRPQQGDILLEQKNLCNMKPKERAKIMTLLEQVHCQTEITVEELVSYGRYPHQKYLSGRNSTEDEIIERALRQTCLESYRTRLLGTLSGGERQRAYIAMALAQDTELIFFDEPTTYLDIHICFEVMELIRSLNRQGKTIVMVLHDLKMALEYSDYLILLENGGLSASGTPDDIVKSGVLDRIFQIKTSIFEDEGRLIYNFSGQRKLRFS